MKKVFITFLISSHLFAYTNWSVFHVDELDVYQLTNRVVLFETQGFVNSCGEFFEGNKFQSKIKSCEHGVLELEVQYKNIVNCEMAKVKSKNFIFVLPKNCDFSMVQFNNHLFN